MRYRAMAKSVLLAESDRGIMSTGLADEDAS
jgi:hypothetical protein